MGLRRESSAKRSRRDAWTIGLLLGAIALALGTTSFVYHRATHEMNAASAAISDSVAPSMDDLSTARGSAFRAGFFLAQFINAPEKDRDALNQRVNQALEDMDQAVLRYSSHPQLPGEAPHIARLGRAIRDLDGAVEEVRALTRTGQHDSAVLALNTSFQGAALEIVEASRAASAFNADAGRTFAQQIRGVRERTRSINFTVEAVGSIALVTAALWLRRRALNDEQKLKLEAAAAEERSKELEQFAGRVAHDIRNPMAASLTASQLMLKRTEDPRVRELANRISQSISRANKIIDGLLEFARSGAQPDPGARSDVRALSEELISAIQPEAEAARITLTLHELPSVLAVCSEGVFHSLLGNLVRNAIKYMDASEVRRIDVRGRMVADSKLRLEIVDTGPGISEENARALFQPYFRVGSIKAEGIGLGLATVRRLAESHGGAAGVESAVGRGSTFWFELPAVGSAQSETAHSPEAEPAELH